MRMFDTIDDKEEWIDEHSKYDRDEDITTYYCPVCHKAYDDIDDAIECCPKDVIN